MLSVNLASDEVDNILYALREQIINSCNTRHKAEFEKASQKIKKAMHKQDGWEDDDKVEDFREKEMVERVMVVNENK
jgi:hypothetical protein